MKHAGNTRTLGYALSILLLPTLLGACGETQAAVQVTAQDLEPEAISITLYSQQAQLFMEYPRLVVGEEGRFLAHLTLQADGSPLRSGSVRLEVGPAAKPLYAFTADQPTRDGLFIPVGAFPVAGAYEARIVVQSDALSEVFAVPNFVVHPDVQQALLASTADATDEVADAVPFLLEQQWAIGMRMQAVTTHSLTERISIPGSITARPESQASVGAPVNGVLQASDNGALPRIGVRVQAGDVLGYIEAPLTTSDRAQLETVRTDLLAREMELEAKVIEVRRDFLDAEAQLGFASQALERITAMRSKGLGTVADLEAKQRDMAVAEASLQGAQKLQDSFQQTRERLADLRNGLTGNITNGMRYALVAPIAGELIAVDAHVGDALQAQQRIFHIVDAERVWLELHVSEFDLGHLADGADGLLKTSLDAIKRYHLIDDLQGELVHIGRKVDPQDRSIRMVFEIRNPDQRFPLGLLADVALASKTESACLAVPESAVVRDLSHDVVFVVLEGETLQRREVELGIHDGGWLEVKAGLQVGERVVTHGAFQVKLASASPASFGHGHTH